MARSPREFFRNVVLRFDRNAAKRMEEEVAESLERAGKAGSEELEKALEQGGRTASRALAKAVTDEYRATLAKARVDLAKGLIDPAQFQAIRAQADQTFNRSLLAGMERLRSEGKLTELQFTHLAGRLKDVGAVGVQSADGVRSRFRSLATEARDLFSSRLAGAISVAAIFAGLRRATQEADEFESAVAQLDSTARQTGVGLGFLQQQAAAVEEEFYLTTANANALTSEVARLTAKAGDIALTGEVMRAFLDLGASRRLTTEQTLQAVRQAILGIDEGTDKLFGVNPSVLYAEFAASVGKSASALTEQEKALAIAHAALQYGGRVRGDYAKWLETAQGRQQRFNKAISEFGVVVGQALRPVRELAYTIGAWLADRGREFIGGIQILAAELGAFFWGIPHRFRLFLAAELEDLATWIDAARGLLSKVGIDVGGDFVAGLRETSGRMRAEAEKQLEFLRQGVEETKREIVNAVSLTRDMAPGTALPTKAQSTGEPEPALPAARVEVGTSVQPAAPAAPALAPVRMLGPAPAPRPDDGGAWDAFFQRIQDQSYDVASNMTDAFSGFFEATFEGLGLAADGFASFGDAAAGIGRAVVASLIEGQADYHFAQAAGKLAEGIWPPNPAALAAAGQHMLAAGLFKALGNIVGGAREPRFGMASPVPFGAGGYAPRSFDETSRPRPEVHIYIDPLNPYSPAWQEAVYAAHTFATERFGEGATVHVHPRTRGAR